MPSGDVVFNRVWIDPKLPLYFDIDIVDGMCRLDRPHGPAVRGMRLL